MSDYSKAKREYDAIVAGERAETAMTGHDPHMCSKCNHYFDTPNHEYGCEDSPRKFKKSEVTILNSPVPDSSGRLTKKIFANKHLPECLDYDEWEVFDDTDGHKSIRSVCICPSLIACEERVEREQMEHLLSHRNEWIADGYTAATNLHHTNYCCAVCDYHVMPHRRCILR